MTEVRIALNGKDMTLQCTLRAAKTINIQLGSLGAAQDRIQSFDFQAYAVIIAAGIGADGPKAVEDDLFANGLPPLYSPLTQYCFALANGGRLPNSEDDKPKAKPVGEA